MSPSRARPRLAAIALAVGLLTPGAARADRTQECLDASLRGQKLRDAGALRAARAELLACARADCPALVRTSCTEWATDVEARLPTVVLHAQSAAGDDLGDVDVTLDGAPLASSLDGKPITADPGAHTLRFVRRPSGEAVRLDVVLVEGEKRRLLRVRFAPEAAPLPAVSPPPAHASRDLAEPSPLLRPLPLALGGVALAGGVVFTVFALRAQGSLDELRATCAPSCTAESFDPVRRDALVADLGLAVGVVALASAAWIVLSAKPSARRTAGALLLPAQVP